MRLIPIWIFAAAIGTLVACGSAEVTTEEGEATEEAAEEEEAEEEEAEEAEEASEICCEFAKDGKNVRRLMESDACDTKSGTQLEAEKCPTPSKGAPKGPRKGKPGGP